MADGDKYTWIPAYEAIATTLLDYEERQDELTAIVHDVIGDSFDQMDPLTFFSMFNGKLRRDDRRIEAVKKVIAGLDLEVEPASDFWAIPITDARQWRFWGGEPGQVEDNWSVFRSALVYADGPSAEARAEFIKSFDAAKARKNVGNSNLTMALYWARPRFFLPLDGNTQTYLRNRYRIAIPAPLTGEAYLQLVDQVEEAVKKPFVELSFAAWELSGWIPAPSEWEPGIDADQWETLLKDPSIADATSLIALKCLYEHPNGATCSELAGEYGRGPSYYSNAITNLGRRVIDRCRIESRQVENGKYWPVTCIGNYVANRRKGVFEWRLRSEVLEAVGRLDLTSIPTHEPKGAPPWFDEGRLRKLIALYKEDFGRFRGDTAPKGDQESYKWDRVANFQENWDIEADDFSTHVVAALKPAAQGEGQLLGSGHEYSFDRLVKLLGFDQEGVREAFRVLYDTTMDLASSYGSFRRSVDDLVRRYNEASDTPMNDAFQNAKAASVYLFFRYPDRYHYYKPTVADSLCNVVGSVFPTDSTERFLAYEALCDAMMPVVMSDTELLALSDSVLDDRQLKADPAHHLLLQDIGYYCDVYMKEWHSDWQSLLEDAEGTEAGGQEEPMNAPSYPKNIILYGPPGTGKTYQTKAYAVAICEGKRLEDVLHEMSTEEGYGDVTSRYKKLVDAGRVGFTTFHQSYSYEDFIEGIRPETDGEGRISYAVRKGLFRSFCDDASDMVSAASEAGSFRQFPENPNPKVWKMGLSTSEMKDLYLRCREEGSIRLGWDTVPLYEVEESEGSAKIGDNTKRSISRFQDEMEPGDFVILTSGPDPDRYGVALVTGEFEWHENDDGAKRYRSAQWLSDIERAKVVALNKGVQLVPPAIYPLSRFTASQLVEAMGLASATEVEKRERLPYVFIIDEINRGNVSRVLGELITLLEPKKRKGGPEELTVKLPYSGDEFSVPSNVYIIGTMNTADRSTAFMDTALRRRFVFREVMPEPSVLDGINVEGVDISRMLSVMNNRIELLYDREHTFGHAYFVDLKDDPTIECLRDIFRDKLIPQLQEYFFEDYGKIRSVLGAAADDFLERNDGASAFWVGDTERREVREIYRLLQTPTDPSAYARIYQTDLGA